MNKEAIKTFVQSTLGCGCPEEVFQHIACDSAINQNGFRIRYKLNIGNRLLVYIFPVVSADSLEETLQRLVDIGKSERDRSGFNRFRLVLAADDEVRIRKRAEDLFQKIRKDERVHLHIFPETSIPQF